MPVKDGIEHYKNTVNANGEDLMNMFRRVAMAAPIVVMAAASIPSGADAQDIKQTWFDLQKLKECITFAQDEYNKEYGKPGARDMYKARIMSGCKEFATRGGLGEANTKCDESCAQAAVDEAADYQPQR